MPYCVVGRFHPFTGLIHGMFTFFSVGAVEVAFMKAFLGAFTKIHLLLSSFNGTFVA